MHDTIAKHSPLTMLRASGDAFEPVAIPDLLQAACQRLQIPRPSVASSGQRPLRWQSDDTLSVEVTARTRTGGQRKVTLQLHAPRDAAPTIKSK
jgi:hypothetical protein